ncbi:MAG: F0F1 ATP synthase subunit B [Oscillospiraceae bacterium]|nr:F0F1 ATP synthase subunit B [Oscillospiraceae bacterium]
MQTLDVISVNIWQILISLINLVLLFLIIKRFLFKPVKKIMEKRENEINDRYNLAKEAEDTALESKKEWEEKLSGASKAADDILKNATEQAKYRGDILVLEAKEKADGIIRMAKNEAELERKKAADGIKREIVDVSGKLAEKMLEREINTEDHRALIDSFIEEIGDNND